MDAAFSAQLALGIAVGLRHAFEPDHLAAVSTLVAGERRLLSAVRVGCSWGLGHTSTLVVGVAVLPYLGIQAADLDLRFFELPVAVMLFALGGRALFDAAAAWRPNRAPATRRPERAGEVRSAAGGSAWRSYAVGTVHGMAGSGALLLLVAATLASATEAVTYALFYGMGSVLGMGAVTLLLALPFRSGRSRPRLLAAWTALSGVLSLLLGAMILWDVWTAA